MSRDLRETKEPPGKNISQGRNLRKFLTWKNAGISSEKKDGQDGWSIVSRHHICVSSLSSSFVFSFFFRVSLGFYKSKCLNINLMTLLSQPHNPISKAKYSFEFKLKVVQEYLNGKGSHAFLAKQYNLHSAEQVRNWAKAYQEFGKEGLMRSRQNKNYSFQFKLHVVEL